MLCVKRKKKLTVIASNVVYKAILWPQEDAKGPNNNFIQYDTKIGKNTVNIKGYWKAFRLNTFFILFILNFSNA